MSENVAVTALVTAGVVLLLWVSGVENATFFLVFLLLVNQLARDGGGETDD